jgi:hypothetical protein
MSLINALSKTLTTAQTIRWFAVRGIEMVEHLVDCDNGNRIAIESVISQQVIPSRMIVERPEDENKDIMGTFK